MLGSSGRPPLRRGQRGMDEVERFERDMKRKLNNRKEHLDEASLQRPVSLPPQVRGHIQGEVTLTIGRCLMKSNDVDPADLLLKIKWWGEPGKGIVVHVPTLHEVEDGKLAVVRFPVRSGPKQISQYFADMAELALDVVDDMQNVVIGRAFLPVNNMDLNSNLQQTNEGYLQILSGNGDELGHLSVVFSVDFETEKRKKLEALDSFQKNELVAEGRYPFPHDETGVNQHGVDSFAQHRRALAVLTRKTGLDKYNIEELVEAFNRHSAKYRTDVLDRSGFQELLRTELEINNGALADRLFAALDSNRSNRVDYREYVSGLAVMVKGSRRNKIKHSFMAFDTDGDGYLSRREAKGLLAAFLRTGSRTVDLLIAAYEQVFEDDYRTLTAVKRDFQPFHDYVKHQFDTFSRDLDEMVAGLFKSADLNQDGRLSLPEFARWCEATPAIMDWLDSVMDGHEEDFATRHPPPIDYREGMSRRATALKDLQVQYRMNEIFCRDLTRSLGAVDSLNFGQFEVFMKRSAHFKGGEKSLQYLFNCFDVERRGRLTKAQLAAGLVVLTGGSWVEKMETAFSMFDGIGDGSLTRTELRKFIFSYFIETSRALESLLAQYNEIFMKRGLPLDHDLLSFLNDSARTLQFKLENIVEDAFLHAEVRGDGRITFAGFRKFAERDPILAQWNDRVAKELDTHVKGRSFVEPEHRERIQVRDLQIQTGLRELSLQDLQSMFPGRGEITYHVFEDIMLQKLSTANRSMLKRIFTIFDTNKNGKVDQREFIAGLATLVRGDKIDKIEFAFKAYDIDGDGYLSRPEVRSFLDTFFVNGAQMMHEFARDFRDVFGDDNRGFDPEYVTLLHGMHRKLAADLDDKVEEVFLQADKDNDGRISWREFVNWVERHPDMIDWTDKILRQLDADGGYKGGRAMYGKNTGRSTISELQRKIGLHKLSPKDIIRSFPKRMKMDRLAFENFMLAKIGGLSRTILQRMFKIFDTNNDNGVDRREMMAGLLMLVGGTRHDKMEQAFRAFDVSGDGYLNRMEVRAMMKSFMMQSTKLVENLMTDYETLFGDRELIFNGDYVNTIRSVHHTLETRLEDLIDNLFHSCDANRDGHISYKEFEKWVTRNHDVSEWFDRIAAQFDSVESSEATRGNHGRAGFAADFKRVIVSLSDVQKKAKLHRITPVELGKAFLNKGRLDQRPFELILHRTLKIPNTEFVNRLFRVFDPNNNGKVERKPVLAGLCLLTRGTIHEKLEFSYRAFDTNGDGYLTKRELKQTMYAFFVQGTRCAEMMLAGQHELFGEDDTDVDMGHLQSIRYLRRLFENKLDQLVDEAFHGVAGKISYHEYQGFVLRHNEVNEWIDAVASQLDAGAEAERDAERKAGHQRGRVGLGKGMVIGDLQSKIKFNKLGLLDLGKAFNAVSRLDRRAFEDLMFNTVRGIGTKVCNLLFDAFDINRDGRVDRREFLAGLSLLCKGDRHDKLEFAFKAYDLNGDNYLSKSEVRQFMDTFVVQGTRMLDSLMNNYSTVFGDRDNGFDAEYVAIVRRIGRNIERRLDSLVDDAMQNADANNDGKLSWGEFQRWALRHPEITDWLDKVAQQLDAASTPGGASAHAKDLRGRVSGVAGAPSSIGQRMAAQRRVISLSDLQKRMGFHLVTAIDFPKLFPSKGKIDRRQMETILQRKIRGIELRLVNRLFDVLDSNRDGRVDRREIIVGLILLCRGDRRDKLEIAFKVFDANGDGFLSWKELRQFMTSFLLQNTRIVDDLMTKYGEVFNDRTSGFDGPFHTELRRILRNLEVRMEGLVDEAFLGADQNQDGRISWPEFQRWTQTQNEILEFMDKIASMLDGGAKRNLIQPSSKTSQMRPITLRDMQRKAGLQYVTAGELLESFPRRGTIDRAQFETIMMRAVKGITPKVCMRVFDAMDINHDGRLTRHELVGGLAVLCRGSRHDKLEFVFKAFDQDEDGHLRRDEVRRLIVFFMINSTKLLDQLMTGYSEVFMERGAGFAADKLNRVRKIHRQLQAQLNEMVDEMFMQSDLDGNEKISWPEFHRWAQRSPDVNLWMEDVASELDAGVVRNGPGRGYSKQPNENAKLMTLRELIRKLRLNSLAPQDIMKAFPIRGKVDRRGFEAIMQRTTRGLSPKIVSKVFDVFDINGDGKVDRREMIAGLSLFCRGTRRDKIEFAFRAFDINGDGALSPGELREFISVFFLTNTRLTEALMRSYSELFGDWDTRFADDVLDDILAIIDSMERRLDRLVEEAFQSADVNEDGKITFSEFYSWCMRNPDIIKWTEVLASQTEAELKSRAPSNQRGGRERGDFNSDRNGYRDEYRDGYRGREGSQGRRGDRFSDRNDRDGKRRQLPADPLEAVLERGKQLREAMMESQGIGMGHHHVYDRDRDNRPQGYDDWRSRRRERDERERDRANLRRDNDRPDRSIGWSTDHISDMGSDVFSDVDEMDDLLQHVIDSYHPSASSGRQRPLNTSNINTADPTRAIDLDLLDKPDYRPAPQGPAAPANMPYGLPVGVPPLNNSRPQTSAPAPTSHIQTTLSDFFADDLAISGPGGPGPDTERFYVRIDQLVGMPSDENANRKNMFVVVKFSRDPAKNWKTPVVWNTNSPRFKFAASIPMAQSAGFMDHVQRKPLILEVWDKFHSGQESLVGIVKVPLHRLHTTEQARNLSMLKQQPTLAYDGLLPIHNPMESAEKAHGNLKVTVAMGTQRQLEALSARDWATRTIQRYSRGYVTRKNMKKMGLTPKGKSKARTPADGAIPPAIMKQMNPHEELDNHYMTVSIVSATNLPAGRQTHGRRFVRYVFPGEKMESSTQSVPNSQPHPLFECTTEHYITLPRPKEGEAAPFASKLGNGIPFDIVEASAQAEVVIGRATLAYSDIYECIHADSTDGLNTKNYLLPIEAPSSSSNTTLDDSKLKVVIGFDAASVRSKRPLFSEKQPLMSAPPKSQEDLLVTPRPSPPPSLHHRGDELGEPSLVPAKTTIHVDVLQATGLQAAAQNLASRHPHLNRLVVDGLNPYCVFSVFGTGNLSESLGEKPVITPLRAQTFSPDFHFSKSFNVSIDAELVNHIRNGEAIFELWHREQSNSSKDQDRDFLLGSAGVGLAPLLQRRGGISGWCSVYTPDGHMVGALQLNVSFDKDGSRPDPRESVASLAPPRSEDLPPQCKVTVMVEDIVMPRNRPIGDVSPEDDRRWFYCMYRYYQQSRPTVSRLYKRAGMDSRTDRIEMHFTQSFVNDASDDFLMFLSENKLEIQCCSTLRDAVDTHQDKLLGSAFIDLSPLLSDSSTHPDSRKNMRWIGGLYPLILPAAAHLSDARVRIKVCLEVATPEDQRRAANVDGGHMADMIPSSVPDMGPAPQPAHPNRSRTLNLRELQQRTGLDTVEVADLMTLFPSTRTFVDRYDFESIMKSRFPEMDAKLIGLLFAAFDINKDNRISRRELVQGLAFLCRGTRDSKLQYAFRACDADGNGYVSRSELRSFIRSFFIDSTALLHNLVHQWLDEYEEISSEDLAMLRRMRERLTEGRLDVLVEDAFRSADSNNDNRISWDEFIRWGRTHPDVTDWLDNLAAVFESVTGIQRREVGDESGRIRNSLEVCVENAVNLPHVRSASGESIPPSTYITFEMDDDGKEMTTDTVENTINPSWFESFEVPVPTDSRTFWRNFEKGNGMVLKVWHADPELRRSTRGTDNHLLLGCALVELYPLLAGMSELHGWYHIYDFKQRRQGQVKLRVTPRQKLLNPFSRDGRVSISVDGWENENKGRSSAKASVRSSGEQSRMSKPRSGRDIWPDSDSDPELDEFGLVRNSRKQGADRSQRSRFSAHLLDVDKKLGEERDSILLDRLKSNLSELDNIHAKMKSQLVADGPLRTSRHSRAWDDEEDVFSRRSRERESSIRRSRSSDRQRESARDFENAEKDRMARLRGSWNEVEGRMSVTGTSPLKHRALSPSRQRLSSSRTRNPTLASKSVESILSPTRPSVDISVRGHRERQEKREYTRQRAALIDPDAPAAGSTAGSPVRASRESLSNLRRSNGSGFDGDEPEWPKGLPTNVVLPETFLSNLSPNKKGKGLESLSKGIVDDVQDAFSSTLGQARRRGRSPQRSPSRRRPGSASRSRSRSPHRVSRETVDDLKYSLGGTLADARRSRTPSPPRRPPKKSGRLDSGDEARIQRIMNWQPTGLRSRDEWSSDEF